MAVAPGALSPCAKETLGAAEVGLCHSARDLAQGTVAGLGRGASVGEAARRRRPAQSRSDPRTLGRTPRRYAQLARFAVDGADVPGLEAAARTLTDSLARCPTTRRSHLAEGDDIARTRDGRGFCRRSRGGHPISFDALGE